MLGVRGGDVQVDDRDWGVLELPGAVEHGCGGEHVSGGLHLHGRGVRGGGGGLYCVRGGVVVLWVDQLLVPGVLVVGGGEQLSDGL